MSALITYVSTVRGVNVLNILREKNRKDNYLLPRNGIAADILKKINTKMDHENKTESENNSDKNSGNNDGNKENNEDKNEDKNKELREKETIEVGKKEILKCYQDMGEEDMRTGQALYVIGRTAEHTGPR